MVGAGEFNHYRPLQTYAAAYKISTKSSNLRLSYSDLKIQGLGADLHVRFHGRWISILERPPWIYYAYPSTKFERNQTIDLEMPEL